MEHLSKEKTSIRRAVWFSRILRWTLGGFFAGVGIYYLEDGGWPAILFGGLFIVSGFFKPRRCFGGECEV